MLAELFGGISGRVIYALVTAFLTAFMLTPWTIARLKRKQFGQVIRDEGVESHKKKAGVPTMGGIVMLVAVVVATLFWARWSWQIGACLVVTVALGVLGFLDDFAKVTRKDTAGVSGRMKLAIQGLVALGLGVYLVQVQGYEPALFVPVVNMDIGLGWFYVPFVMLVVVGASNAVNLTDGLDGLAAGILATVTAGFAAVSYVAGNTIFSHHLAIPYQVGSGELTIFCAAIAGACFGFLWYNAHPAEVFMGDTGSLSLGGALGVVAVLVRQELMLALVGGIFVLEAVSVMIQVGVFKRTGKRVFRMAPIHHHFELKGWAEPKVVIRFWIITLVLALLGFSVLGFHAVLHRTDADPRAEGAAVAGRPTRLTAARAPGPTNR